MASKNNNTNGPTAEANSAYEYLKEFYECFFMSTDLNSKKYLFLCKLYPPLSEETSLISHYSNEFSDTSNSPVAKLRPPVVTMTNSDKETRPDNKNQWKNVS